MPVNATNKKREGIMYKFMFLAFCYVAMAMSAALERCSNDAPNNDVDENAPVPHDLQVIVTEYGAINVSWKLPNNRRYLRLEICICKKSEIACSPNFIEVVHSYTFTNLSPSTEYVFYIRGDTNSGMGRSSDMLKFNTTDGSPKIVASYDDDFYSVTGETISLLCPISGYKLFYEWFKNGSSIGGSHNLTFQHVSIYDSGKYTCRAKPYNERSKSKQLEVNLHVKKACNSTRNISSNPSLTPTTNFQGNQVGLSSVVSLVQRKFSNITFLCAVKEPNVETFIRWYRDGLIMQEEYYTNNKNFRFHNFSLTMTNLYSESSGKYSCLVYNCHGYTKRDFNLKVVDFIKVPNKFTKALQGHPLTLYSSIGTKSGTYQWLKWSSSNITTEMQEEYLLKMWYYLDQTVSCEEAIAKLSVASTPMRCLPGNDSTLPLVELAVVDSGKYTSFVINDAGLKFEDILVDVQPVVPSTLSPTILHYLRTDSKFLIFIGLCCLFFVIVLTLFALLVLKKFKAMHGASSSSKLVVNTLYETTDVKKPMLLGNVANTDSIPSCMYDRSNSTSTQLDSLSSYAPSSTDVQLPDKWEFPYNRLKIGRVIGEGAFGVVHVAEAVGITRKEKASLVAVKMLKATPTKHDLRAFVEELQMMKCIGRHPNIINLLGCCTQGGPLIVVIEYAKQGNLRDYLRLNRPLVCSDACVDHHQVTLLVKDLLSISYQVAKGMEYLSSKKCIHRDLAARNILVTEDFVMKIADFGFARDMKNMDYYRKETKGWLPVKWMAPETMFDYVFTTQSDVWSFGVLLWETMTLGMTPYPGVPTDMVLKYLMDKKRMSRPHGCSLDIYHVMTECWQFCPKERPTFPELVQDISRILHQKSNQEYLDLDVGAATSFSMPLYSADEEVSHTSQLA